MKRQVRKKSLTKRLSTTKDSQRLERETRKLVNKANARLDSLQRRYRSGTWATKKLANRLSSNKVINFIKRALSENNFTDTHRVLVVAANNETILNTKYAPKNIKDKVTYGGIMQRFITNSAEETTEDEE